MRRSGVVIPSFLLLVCLFGLGSSSHAAELYPVKPINFIVPVEAGGDADILARRLCQRASAILGQPIMIVNKPGGGTSIAMREINNSNPNGYSIGMNHTAIIISKLTGIMPYDHEAFTLLGSYATFVPIVVSSTKTKRPFKSMEEVLSFAKSHPEEVSIASSGVGNSWWVAALLFQEGTGAKFNIIPLQGSGAVTVTQAAGGHTDLAILALAAAKSQIEAGNVRFAAVFGSKKVPGYETVPTMSELGYSNVRWESTQVLIGPPKMPKDVVDKLVKAFETASNEPEYKKFLIEMNAVPFYLPPDEARTFLNEQRVVVRGIMEKAGILKEK